MNDSLPVGCRQGLGKRSRNREKLLQGQPTLRDSLGERLALNELHREERDAAYVLDGVEVHDVRVVQCRDGPGLSLEPLASLRVREPGRKNLEGDEAAKLGVLGGKHFAHPTATDALNDAIVTEPRPGFDA